MMKLQSRNLAGEADINMQKSSSFQGHFWVVAALIQLYAVEIKWQK